MNTIHNDEHLLIEELLVGRKVTKVAENQLQLDNGTILTFVGHEGCGGCSNGWYEVTQLNGVDNIITKVEFVEAGESPDIYMIFVYADNQRINLVTVEGGDNGYYGTGYSITVQTP